MDKEFRKKVMLGLFVVIGLGLFIIGIFLIGSKSEMFTKSFIISARFKDAAGLKKGGNVRFNGVKVGIVDAVTILNDTAIQVDMKIEEAKHKFITQFAIAKIASDGLMGDKMIDITNLQPGGAAIADKGTITSRNPLNTDDMLETLNATNKNVKVITDNLKVLTDNLNNAKGTFQALYKDTTMAINIKQSINNFKAMSLDVAKAGNDIKQITWKIQNGNGSMSRMINDTTLGHNLATAVNKLKSVSEKLNSASDQINVTMTHINSGEGTVNQVLTDPKLSANVKQSVENIKTASVTLNEDLEALKHSIFLRGYFKKKAKGK
jgi:phospholipid/cholesterol/gamma-HCH transport system substrate-binding protein